ncbi:MAG: AI-2E family transporter [candidate division NC10 bacterium]|nr:AI-2E family transporter [candidate division NC10 bacterium]
MLSRSSVLAGPLLALGGLVAAGWVLYRLRGLLGLLLLAALLAYLLDPAVTALGRLGLTRGAAALLLGLALLVVSGLALLLIVPALWEELLLARERLPAGLAAVERTVRPAVRELTGRDLPMSPAEWVREGMGRVESLLPHGLALLRDFVVGTFSGVVAFVLNLLALTVIPVFTYYLLREFPLLLARAEEAIPRQHRARVAGLARELDGILRAFFRGQLTVCAIVGGCLAVGLAVLRVDLALLLGFLSGAAIRGGGGQFLGVAGLYGAVATLEGFVLTPRVTGRSVGLHPAVALLAVLVGGHLFGFWGLLLGLPGAAVVKVLGREGLQGWRRDAGREEGA